MSLGRFKSGASYPAVYKIDGPHFIDLSFIINHEKLEEALRTLEPVSDELVIIIRRE